MEVVCLLLQSCSVIMHIAMQNAVGMKHWYRNPKSQRQVLAAVLGLVAIGCNPHIPDQDPYLQQSAPPVLQSAAPVPSLRIEPRASIPFQANRPDEQAAQRLIAESGSGDTTTNDFEPGMSHKTAAKGPDSAGKFITAFCEDATGALWIATEDQGVICQRADGMWHQFTVATTGGIHENLGPVLSSRTPNQLSIADNSCYALACDNLGRVWAGTLNHGVSVYNGHSWKNYDVLSGPLGERVFDIAVVPSTASAGVGDVWIATNRGLSCYHVQTDRWTHRTRADGLPSNQIQAIAFDADARLYAGTQCDGIVASDADTEYREWATVGELTRKPNAPAGEGLPSLQINDVLVTDNQVVFVATNRGIARSSDRGRSWKFVRGRDWAAKAKGQWLDPPKTVNEKLPGAILREDFVTCLTKDDHGRVWIGYRQSGCDIFGADGTRPLDLASVEIPQLEYVTAILPRRGRSTCFGTYGAGLVLNQQPEKEPPSTLLVPAEAIHPSQHPRPAEVVPEDLLKRLANAAGTIVGSSEKETNSPAAAYLDDDWTTQGDWMGRYGRRYAILCATRAPWNDELPNIWPEEGRCHVHAQIGPHATRDDAIRHWIHWRETDDRRTLYNPTLGYRRQSEWDDHGEEYPMSFEGPDIWVTVEVPQGIHRVSMYFFNKDGHGGSNRFRDYLLEVKHCVTMSRSDPKQRAGLTPPQHTGPLENLPRAEKLPTLARARVRDFWGGVHKQFLLRGPNIYLVKIARNGSFNTIVSSVFVDTLAFEERFGSFLPWMNHVSYMAPTPIFSTESLESGDLKNAAMGWDLIAHVAKRSPAGGATWHAERFNCLRAASGSHGSQCRGDSWRWPLCVWNQRDREQHHKTMVRAWYAHQSSAR